MHQRLPLKKHENEKSICWCNTCRQAAYVHFPPDVRDIERGFNPQRLMALQEDLKSTRDVLEELVKNLGITVQRKSRRLNRPITSSFQNARSRKLRAWASELQVLIVDITSSIRKPNSKKINSATPNRTMRRAKRMFREH